MSLDFDAYEQAVSARLEPLRTALASVGVPVAFLPRQASKVGDLEHQGHISIAFPDSEGQADAANELSQRVTVNLEVRVSLSDRYKDAENPNPVETEATLNWCVKNVIGLLILYRLPVPRIKGVLRLTRHRLFAPKGDRWEAMIRFNFEVSAISSVEVDTSEIPKVTEIEAVQRGDQLFVVRKAV